MDSQFLAKRFQNFANYECKGSSLLYEILASNLSEDVEMLELSSYSAPGQPVPNLFLASVHYLLLKGYTHDLKAYYPDLTPDPRLPEDVFPYFKDFCRQHREELIAIMRSKLVQTNEIRRCAYLYPSFCYIYEKTKMPLALIEIGTSAGLQLMWDQYRYSYGTQEVYGNPTSTVHLTAELRNGNPPLLFPNSPPVATKIGIDLNVLDVLDSEDYLWLQSLIWPEHHERRQVLEQVVGVFKENPVHLLEGDGITMLMDVVDQVPKDSALCIFHTHVANQLSEAQKTQLIKNVATIGAQRNVFHLYNNIWDIGNLYLDYFIDGNEFNLVIGETDGHGRWFDWEL